MAGTLVLRGGTVLLPDGRLEHGDLLVEDGSIAGVRARSGAPARRHGASEQLDVSGCTVLPGFVDLHTHGIARLGAAEAEPADYAREEAARGATAFLLTLFGPPEPVAAQMRRHRAASLAATPAVVGFRLETPYLARTGAGRPGDLARIDEQVTASLLEAGEGRIRIWDVSPELPGAIAFIRTMASHGIVASIAHTSATIDEGRAAVDAGARLVTHLFDVFDVPERTEPGVYPAGLVDYLLVEDRVCCELIVDGTHVPPLLVEKAWRCKGPERLAFVTDSNLGAGLAPGRYRLSEDWGEVEVQGPDHGVRLVERGMVLAGSAMTPLDSFRNAVRRFGKTLAEASVVCSRTPARLLGLTKGAIAPGFDADLVVLDEALELRYTIVAGRLAHGRP